VRQVDLLQTFHLTDNLTILGRINDAVYRVLFIIVHDMMIIYYSLSKCFKKWIFDVPILGVWYIQHHCDMIYMFAWINVSNWFNYQNTHVLHLLIFWKIYLTLKNKTELWTINFKNTLWILMTKMVGGGYQNQK
jgi:hypothetical protein